MSDKPIIPPDPALRTPGHQQVTERLGRKLAHLDLESELALLRGEQVYARVGRNSKTIVRRPDFRVVLISIRQAARMTDHVAAGPLAVYVLHGQIRMHMDDGTVELGPGHLLALERNERHDVEAVEESAFLLTIAWPQDRP